MHSEQIESEAAELLAAKPKVGDSGRASLLTPYTAGV